MAGRAEGGGRAEEEAPADLFEDEEHPVTIVLCLLSEFDARDLVDLLEKRGIGARMGEHRADDTVEVLIHEFRLPEAQAILVDFTGDTGLLDDVTEAGGDSNDDSDEADDSKDGSIEADDEAEDDSEENADDSDSEEAGDAWAATNRRVWGTGVEPDAEAAREDDAAGDDYVLVASGLPANADRDARRLEAEGLDVLVRMPGPDEGTVVADVLVHRDDLAAAREILGIKL